jgi:hypothetical protein
MHIRSATIGALLLVAACTHAKPESDTPPGIVTRDTVLCKRAPCGTGDTRAKNVGDRAVNDAETAVQIRAQSHDGASVIGSVAPQEQVTLLVERRFGVLQRGVVQTAGDGLAVGDVVDPYYGPRFDGRYVRGFQILDDYDEDETVDIPPVQDQFVLLRGRKIKVRLAEFGGPVIKWEPTTNSRADDRTWFQVRTDQGVTGWAPDFFCPLRHSKYC